MTVSSTNNKDTYSGNGSTTVFAYTYRILNQADILVQLKDSAGTDVPVDQTITTDYTVSGVGDAAGGNITFVTAPVSTDTVIFTRSVDIKQETDYVENDSFPAETHEEALDRLTMISQGQDERLIRSIKLDPAISGFDTTIPTPVAEQFIQINAANDGLQLASDTSVIGGLDKTDGTFYVADGTTVVAEAGATARASMGVSIGSQVQAWDAQLDDIAALAVTNSNFIVGDGSNWVAETGATFRTSAGLGTGDSPTFTGLTLTGTLDVAADIVHTGDTNNKITFTTDTQTFTTGGSSRADITDSGLRLGAANARVTTVLDEDAMGSDSATSLSTQQSIKAYVDSGTVTFTNKTFDANGTGNSISNIDLTADVINDLPITEGGTGASDAATGLSNLGGIGAATTDTLTNKTINTASNTITVVEADISDLGSYITPSSTDTLTNKTFDANGTGNSISNIDVADLANGTDGELQTWDAAGAPTTVEVGTINHVLTSNGAGAAPTFQAAAVGSLDWELITVATASDDATIDFTGLSSTYHAYKLIATGLLPATDAVEPWIRIGTGGTPTYQSGASDYAWSIGFHGSSLIAVRDDADSQIGLTDSGSIGTVNNTAEMSFELTILDPSDAGQATFISADVHILTSNLFHNHVTGLYLADTAVTALRFLYSSGNVSVGDFRLYGIRKA